MATTEVGSYREYVASRLDPLRRSAYLRCGDWHTADDLVSIAFVKLLRHWRRVSGMEHTDAYVRRLLAAIAAHPWTSTSAWMDTSPNS